MEKFIAGIQIANLTGTCVVAKFVYSKGKSYLLGKRLRESWLSGEIANLKEEREWKPKVTQN